MHQIYFDIVAQGVFYSFFYAFPRSRLEFDDNYKKYVFSVFSKLFTDMEISHHSEFIKGYNFIENWKLDLGAGDVLKQSRHMINEVQQDSQTNETAESILPPLRNYGLSRAAKAPKKLTTLRVGESLN